MVYFVNNIDLPCCCVVFFLFASSLGWSNGISASYRHLDFHCLNKDKAEHWFFECPPLKANKSSENYITLLTKIMITCQNRVTSTWGAGKQQRIQHSNRESQFYSQNIPFYYFLSKTIAFPYKPWYVNQIFVTQHHW